MTNWICNHRYSPVHRRCRT